MSASQSLTTPASLPLSGWHVQRASFSPRNGGLFVVGTNYETTNELDRTFYWHINDLSLNDPRFDFTACIFEGSAKATLDRMLTKADAHRIDTTKRLFQNFLLDLFRMLASCATSKPEFKDLAWSYADFSSWIIVPSPFMSDTKPQSTVE